MVFDKDWNFKRIKQPSNLQQQKKYCLKKTGLKNKLENTTFENLYKPTISDKQDPITCKYFSIRVQQNLPQTQPKNPATKKSSKISEKRGKCVPTPAPG